MSEENPIPTPADIAPPAQAGPFRAQASAPQSDPAQDDAPAPKVEEIDWKAEARKWEQRAKDNKGAADKLAEIEEANKTEAQRAAEALEKAQQEAATATTELLRYRAAAAHGITDAEDIELFLTGTDEDTLERQAKALAARTVPNGPRTPKPDPNQGRAGASPETNGDRFASVIGPLIR